MESAGDAGRAEHVLTVEMRDRSHLAQAAGD